MKVENLVGADEAQKIWEDDTLEMYMHIAIDGEVWVHNRLKQPMTKTKYKQAPISMLNFYEQFNKITGVNKIYTVATKGTQVDWAVYGGWEPKYDCTVDGVDATVLEYCD